MKIPKQNMDLARDWSDSRHRTISEARKKKFELEDRETLGPGRQLCLVGYTLKNMREE